MLICPAAVLAQNSTAPASAAADSVAAGTFRGTHIFKARAADLTPGQPAPVAGIASWRLELDSLDWRRKLTIRLTITEPDSAIIIIRMARAEVPRGAVVRKAIPSSHVDPAYYTSRMSVRERGSWQNYDGALGGRDTLVFDTTGILSPATLLHGTVRTQGYGVVSNYTQPRKTHVFEGSFAARFDPRVDSVPRSMTPELATKLLAQALYDFAVGWVGGRVNPSLADSTTDDAKARAYLMSRWGEAATIDSLAVGPKRFYVRMRARFAPVTCVVTHDSSGPSCTRPPKRHWWSRADD